MNPQPPLQPPKSPVGIVQILLGIGAALIFAGLVVLLIKAFVDPASIIKPLADASTARGMITFVIAVTTAFMALVLIGYIVFGPSDGDPSIIKERFDYGKQVLALFLGILGTIVGFYYGSTTGVQSVSKLQFSTPILTPAAAQPGGTINIATNVSGGKPPYTYSITFDPLGIAPVTDMSTDSGLIVYAAKIPANAKSSTPIKYFITVKDSDNHDESFNKDGKLTLQVQSPSTPSQTSPTAKTGDSNVSLHS